MAFIDKIVKFHTFSKSTVRDNLTLGEAVNPSGHTVVSSQVRTDDIPAFIDTFQDTKEAALTWAATNVDANARHNDILYYGGKFNMGFSNPKCLIRVAKQVVDGKLVDLPAEQHSWQDFTIVGKSFLANADGKDVIAIHTDADICYVHGDNNAAVNSNQNSAFVRKADGSFLDHFVAPTDQILGGQPSLGYGLCLFKSGTTKALTEGEETGKNNYIGNTFAGLIHFMDTRSEAADTADNFKAAGFYVNCFEYIGDKLDTALSDIDAKISQVVGDAFEGAVASVTADTNTKNLGLTVTEGANPVITVTPGTIADSKLVTGSTVKTYVDSATEKATVSPEGVVTTGDEAKLVTATDAQNIAAKAASDQITAAVDDGSVATKKSVDDLSSLVSGLPATIKAAQDTADEALGLAESAIQKVTVNGTESSGTEVSITALTAVDSDNAGSNGITIGETADKKVTLSVTPASYTSSTKSWSNDAYFAKASDIATAISDAVGAIVTPTLSTSSTGVGLSATGHTIDISTANYVASTDTWTNKGYLVTGATVEAFVNDVVSEVSSDLTALETKVNAYHEAGVSYKIHDSQTLPDLSVAENVENYKNVILLVPSAPTPGGYEGQDQTAAITGGYVEWLCVKTGETTYAWEQIGTTEADLYGYVNQVANGQSTTLANQGSVYASISSNGYLTLGVASATDTVMGVSKLFTYYDIAAAPSNATDTAVSVNTAQAMYSSLANLASNAVKSINGSKGDVTLCVHNYKGDYHDVEGDTNGTDISSANLWGMTVASDLSAHVALVDEFVGMSNSYLTTANLPSNAVSVENNFVMDGSGNVITTIRPERMVSGFRANSATGLKSFVGDLSNLETANLNGNGISTFYNITALETFIGDLSSLKYGSNMFSGTSLTTFIGDLSSLEVGAVSLSSKDGMFNATALTVESVENIADTLPENPVVDTSTLKGCIAISWTSLTSDTAERQKLVDALSGVVDKGWVLVTNYELLTMFDTEKYQVVQQTVQPLDLDGEPQEIAYVIKK